MAVDSRDKRGSVLGLGLAVTLVLPLADGTVGTADRAHACYSYRGIAASVPIIVGGKTLSLRGSRTRTAISGSRTRTAISGSRTRTAISGSEN